MTRVRSVPVVVMAVAGCVLLAVALRLPYLHVPLGVDEGGVAAIARQWPGGAHGSLYGGAWLDRPPLLLLVYKLGLIWGAAGIRWIATLAAAVLVVVVALIGHLLGGRKTALTASVLAAVLTGSGAMRAVYQPAELFAAVPAAASILCLLLARRRGDVRWLLGAGALAVAAALVKQSFLDAGLAGAVFLVATGVVERRVPWRAVVAYGVGAALPIAAVVVWQLVAHPPEGGLVYALFGFRLAGLHTLQGSNRPLLSRVHGLDVPALRSGLALALIATPFGLVRLRHDGVVLATACAWLAGGLVGIAGGGYYWPHYLIQVIAVTSVAASLLLTTAPDLLRRAALVGAAALAVAAAIHVAPRVHDHPPHLSSSVVGGWIRRHARPGDTQYVLYSRANVGYYTGLRSPYPYAWSLMVRTVPHAIPRLRRLLASPQRPTWVVRWQHADRWGLDRRNLTRGLLARHYVRVATVDHHPILLRRELAGRRGMAILPLPLTLL